jgi:hypothetical protein
MYACCMSNAPLTRVTANFIPRSMTALNAASERSGDTRTETLNRSVQLYDLITAHIANGGKVLLRDADGETRWMELL